MYKTLESRDEEMMMEYLLQLEKDSVITLVPLQSYTIFDGFPAEYGRVKPKVYTPDFIFSINDKTFQHANNQHLKVSPDGLVYVDVKGEYTKQLTSSITFPDRQAMMWDKHSIYVNKIVPTKLFSKTFVPYSLIKTEVYKKDTKTNKVGDSKFKFKVNTYAEYKVLIESSGQSNTNRRKRNSVSPRKQSDICE
jgi:hypothetical protein